jgi:ABC-2 type transport system permease protein
MANVPLLDLVQRPRRMRRTASLRAMAEETILRPADFIAPLFAVEACSRIDSGTMQTVELLRGLVMQEAGEGEPPLVQAMQVAQHVDGNQIQMYIKELWNLPIATILISFIIYFIGGYFLYSSFYASIGAAVDNETDSQQFLLPIIMPLILGVYIGFFTVINDPHGTVATVFSMIPLTSPIVMMMRIPFGVPLWQIIVSMMLLFGTFLGVVWFAAKIYRVGILMYGKKPTWKELIKWLKY